MVRHTESALETKLTNQFGRIDDAQPDKTRTIDVYQTMYAPGADEWPVLYADGSRGRKAGFSKCTMSCFAAILINSYIVNVVIHY